MRVPLLAGADQRRSLIANNQRRVNYYAEINRKDAAAQFTLYQRPGLKPWGKLQTRHPARGLWRASNGVGYGLFASDIYTFDESGTFTKLGTVSTTFGRASFADNGTTGLLVDGSPKGYKIDLATNVASVLVDNTGTFTGADLVAYLDTFMVWNYPGTRNFGSTLSNQIGFDQTYVAGKVSYPDQLVSLIVSRRQLLLIGSLKSEIWYTSGAALFPFAQVQGAYVEHGTLAAYSVAAQDISVYMLGQDLQGSRVVFEIAGYQAKRISNHALEESMRKMDDVSDAIGLCYQIGGHVFYMLTFPSADQTWVYDASVKEPEFAWYQDATLGPDGKLHRSRINCICHCYDKIIAGDWQTGQLYLLDLDTYTDNGAEVPYIVGSPQVSAGLGPDGFTTMDGDGKMIRHNSFMLDMEVGNGPLRADGTPAQVELWYSNDRGKTFREPMLQSAGRPAEWNARPTFRTGETAQMLQFEIRHNIAAAAPIQGAWLANQVEGQ